MLEYRLRRLPAAREAARRARPRGRPLPLGVGRRRARRHAPSARTATRRARADPHRRARGAHRRRRRLGGVRATSTGPATRPSPPGPARELLVETARYWASRVRIDAGRPRAHLRRHRPGRVPRAGRRQRLHERDGALEPAPRAPRLATASTSERASERWLELADALVDGYDRGDAASTSSSPASSSLEPLVIAEVAPRRPIAADLLLGAERTARRAGRQAGRRADAPPPRARRGRARLARAEPRLLRAAHRARQLALAGDPRGPARPRRPLRAGARGAARSRRGSTSTTSPARPPAACTWRRWAASGRRSPSASPACARAASGCVVDPRLPPEWDALELALRFRGAPLRLRIDRGGVTAEPGPAWAVEQVADALGGGTEMKKVIVALDNGRVDRQMVIVAAPALPSSSRWAS